MAELTETMLTQGVSVDIAFKTKRPLFGDLFLIRGFKHPTFPPSGVIAFDSLADLQFDQVDDYFGVRSLSDEGTDVVIWLAPVVDDNPVDHHPGPFDGVRIDYSILRNPAHLADHYLECLARFAVFGDGVFYRSRGIELGIPPDLSQVRADIDAVIRHWSSKGIEVGSHEALMIHF